MLSDDVEISCANRRDRLGVLAIARAAQRAQLCGAYLSPSPSIRWYCFRTLQGRHAEAVTELDLAQFPTFFPLFRTRRPSGKLDVRSLFPRYGFVAFDVRAPGWRKVCTRPGIEALLSSNPERPTPIPVGVVEGLIAQLGVSGWIDDPDLNPIDAPVAQGLTVRVTSGPFTSFHGVCRWSTNKRIGLLLEMFQSQRPVELSRDQVEIVKQ